MLNSLTESLLGGTDLTAEQVTDAVGQQLAFNKLDPRAKGILASAPAIHREATVWLRDRDSRLESQ